MHLYGRFSGYRSVTIVLAEPFSSEIRASFRNIDCLHVSIRGTIFSLVFSKLLKLLPYGLALVLG